MKQLIQRLTKATVMLVAASAASVCLAQTSFTVGATSTGVPFTFLDVKTNKLQGMMVDTVTAIGKNAGFGVNIQQTPFSALIPSLTSNKISTAHTWCTGSASISATRCIHMAKDCSSMQKTSMSTKRWTI